MTRYYTRACNFYYGSYARKLVQKKRALPLCGNVNIAFDSIEIYSRKKNNVKSTLLNLQNIKNLNKAQKSKVKKDLKKIISKRKNFIKNVNFSKPSIMGILNLTPDSFSDGGKYNKKNKSFNHITNMIKSGASIIDIGGESTRPGSKTIDAKKEWKRVEYVIKSFKKKYKKTCLSLDTRKSTVMKRGLENGVELINDVSGFKYDKNVLSNLSEFKFSKVLHHMQGEPSSMQKNPKYKNVLLDIYDFFENSLKSKFKDRKIILDPGIGFGKTLKHNLILISNISLFHSLGFPLLIGTSRKRFINQISKNYDSKDRIGGTLASVIYLLLQGVQIFRVHNVKEVKQGILVFSKIINK